MTGLGLQEPRYDPLFPLVDLGGGGLGVDDRREVAGPCLTGHQLLQVREGELADEIRRSPVLFRPPAADLMLVSVSCGELSKLRNSDLESNATCGVAIEPRANHQSWLMHRGAG
jgi:hypothetical protein